MATSTGRQNLLPELKSRLQITNNNHDADLAITLEGAWDDVQEFTRRRFYSVTATAYYTADNACRLMTDDILSISALRTDADGDGVYETTWSATCYVLTPRNATIDAKPFTGLRLAYNSSAYLPNGVEDGVQIVGVFGHNPSSALPALVREAILWTAEQNHRVHHAPFGAVGGREYSQEVAQPSVGLHPFVQRKLATFRHREGIH